MSFNENKGFRLVLDGNVVGMVRWIPSAHYEHKRRTLHLCVFVAKDIRKNLEHCAGIMETLYDICRVNRWTSMYHVSYVYNFDYLTMSEVWAAQDAKSKQFGGTARKRSSSVLLDEVSGKPLY